MALPNFIIAGAPKCGTTALWAILQEHPEICLSSHKEPRFFSEEKGDLERGRVGGGQNRSGRFGMGFEWYETLFDECAGAKAIGEASTQYFSAEDSASLIARHLPGARLIFILRDPVQRAYSHYWQEHRLGWDLPPFEEMLGTQHPRLKFYLHVSHYRVHLERFRRFFADDHLLVLLQDDLSLQPSSIIPVVTDFLGVSRGEILPKARDRFNPQMTPRSRVIARLSERIRYHLADRLPSPARKALGKGKRWFDKLNRRPNRYHPLSDPARARLLPEFLEDIAYLEALLGRELAAWKAGHTRKLG